MASPPPDSAGLAAEARAALRRQAEAMQALLDDNERLRTRLAAHEAQVARLEGERDAWRDRHNDVELEHGSLLSLYVASHQLHASLDFEEVRQNLTEIMLNLVGAEVFTVIWAEARRQALYPLIAVGLSPAAGIEAARTSAIVTAALATGAPFVAAALDAHADAELSPLICLPLQVQGRTIGALTVYRFLAHKQALSAGDRELFTLLAGHAASALLAAKLYTAAQRKLTSLKGFIDVVTAP